MYIQTQNMRILVDSKNYFKSYTCTSFKFWFKNILRLLSWGLASVCMSIKKLLKKYSPRECYKSLTNKRNNLAQHYIFHLLSIGVALYHLLSGVCVLVARNVKSLAFNYNNKHWPGTQKVRRHSVEGRGGVDNESTCPAVNEQINTSKSIVFNRSWLISYFIKTTKSIIRTSWHNTAGFKPVTSRLVVFNELQGGSRKNRSN